MRVVILSSLDTTFIYPESVVDQLRLFLTWMISPLKWHVDGMGQWCLILVESSSNMEKLVGVAVAPKGNIHDRYWAKAIDGPHVGPRKITEKTREVTVAASRRFRT
jgi:hypothetical protein